MNSHAHLVIASPIAIIKTKMTETLDKKKKKRKKYFILLSLERSKLNTSRNYVTISVTRQAHIHLRKF